MLFFIFFFLLEKPLCPGEAAAASTAASPRGSPQSVFCPPELPALVVRGVPGWCASTLPRHHTMAVLGPSKAEVTGRVRAPSVDDDEEQTRAWSRLGRAARSSQRGCCLPALAAGSCAAVCTWGRVKHHRRDAANPLRGAKSKGEPLASGCLSCCGLVQLADNRRDASQGK